MIETKISQNNWLKINPLYMVTSIIFYSKLPPCGKKVQAMCMCCLGTLHSCSLYLLATDHMSLEQGLGRESGLGGNTKAETISDTMLM